MNRRSGILFAAALVGTLMTIGCTEDPFVPAEWVNPDADMVLVEGGTYEMGDWLGPYYLSGEAMKEGNIKDVTFGAEHANDFTFDARTKHLVKVDSFYILKTEVTMDQFDRYCYEMLGTISQDGFEGDDDGHPTEWGRDNRPAVWVSWNDAIKFCNWLSIKHGYQECYEMLGMDVRWYPKRNGYRLPTEAEWEYAARGGHLMPTINGGHGHLYAGCDDAAADDSVVDSTGMTMTSYTDQYQNRDSALAKNLFPVLRQYAWFNLTSGWQGTDGPSDANGRAWPVAAKLPTELGLYDMSGNAWEWCWDWYSPDYYKYCKETAFLTGGVTENPAGPLDNAIYKHPVDGTEYETYNAHTLRGGSWGNYPVFLRTTFRFFSMKYHLQGAMQPTYQYDNFRTGFRIVRKAKHDDE